jgi:hypothetical protein
MALNNVYICLSPFNVVQGPGNISLISLNGVQNNCFTETTLNVHNINMTLKKCLVKKRNMWFSGL